MKKEVMPPRLFMRFFRWFCTPDLVDYVEGDLIELYRSRVAKGKSIADLRFIIDVILLFRPGIIRSLSIPKPYSESVMIRNYVTVGFRNLKRYKGFSFINIFGLSLAMSVAMLVILVLMDSNRYDRFHSKSDRIYRILSDTEQGRNPYATSPQPVATALKTDYTNVENAVSLVPDVGGEGYANGKLAEMHGYFTDQSFFDVFDFKLITSGNSPVLTAPNEIVISKEVAKKLFGSDDAVGKMLEFFNGKMMTDSSARRSSWGQFTITGVIDMSAYKSHLQFDVLMSSSTMPGLVAENKLSDFSTNWQWYYKTYTFALMKEGETAETLNHTLADLVSRKYKSITSAELKGFNLTAQPLSEIQFHVYGNDTNTRLPLVGYYFLGSLAAIIMVCATFNYTNLSIARALTRAKEIGVRKVNGALKRNLVFQFIVEAVLTSLLSMLVAFLILSFLRPLFKNLWVNQYLQFELPLDYKVIGVFICFSIGVGFLSGVFPAFQLARFQPVKVLKHLDAVRPGRLRLRKVLTVTQLCISLLFITTSIAIFNQFRHYLTFDYGFSPAGVVNIDLQGHDAEKVMNEFSGIAGVMEISGSDILPAMNVNNGMDIRKPDSTIMHAGIINADNNFLNTLGVKLIAGRTALNDSASVIVNEDFVRQAGLRDPSEAIGYTFENNWNKELLTIAGVCRDFRHISLINSHEIRPLVLRNFPDQFKYIQVKLAGKTILTQLEEKWKRIDPVHPMKSTFYEDDLATMHQGIFDLVSIVGFIAFMAIIIACLGLLGMATYAVERKRKEVGIRKVLGAGDYSVALILSKEFLILLGISIMIAAPLSYFFNTAWLELLPNRVNFGIGMLMLGTALLLILGVITIASQTLRASKDNPVSVLKAD